MDILTKDQFEEQRPTMPKGVGLTAHTLSTGRVLHVHQYPGRRVACMRPLPGERGDYSGNITDAEWQEMEAILGEKRQGSKIAENGSGEKSAPNVPKKPEDKK